MAKKKKADAAEDNGAAEGSDDGRADVSAAALSVLAQLCRRPDGAGVSVGARKAYGRELHDAGLIERSDSGAVVVTDKGRKAVE